MSEKAVLKVGDQQIELPIIEGTEGERAVDISRLRSETGLITYDPSLGNTGVCKSHITFVDGEKGIVLIFSTHLLSPIRSDSVGLAKVRFLFGILGSFRCS